MRLDVRPMKLEEVGLIIDYFQEASAEHLALLGVERERLPDRARWRELYQQDERLPLDRRKNFNVIWCVDGQPFGFSAADRIVFANHMYMHLHIVQPEMRASGYGVECVRRSVQLYREVFEVRRIYCEPNAFNVAPNRTLQKAGFRYVKTYVTVPGPLNGSQAVTQWVYEFDTP